MKLDSKRVVIIGGSSGIGLETARLALQQGALVTIAGRSEERLHRAVASLPEGVKNRVRAVVADVIDYASIGGLFAGEARVDHVFVPAGDLRPGTTDVLTADPGSMRAILEVRLMGASHVVRHAKPHMQDGSITLMSGLYASRPGSGGAMGAAAVAAIEGMARALALDLAPIRVNAVSPGLIDTPLWDSFGPHRESILAAANKLPVGRVGKPEEVAEAVLFLMTNGFVTGIALQVDGGGTLV
jgi:NAD(P)-dependent dehydrogenase (short-subunit alcohol dehydrogenase family)